MRQFNLPEEKLNELAQKVSEKLLSNHFFDQDVILGEELKNFSDHNQINKFLIFQVYQVWDIQVSKLKHPYFDFDQEEVQETLQGLKDKLSRHIRITKDDFQPVLKRAVFNNLKLLLDPQETFENFFFIQSDKIPLDVYKRYTQFFSDLGFLVNSILKYYEKNNIETVEKDVFFLKMNKVVEIYNKKSEKGFEKYREDLFAKLTGVQLSEIEETTKAEIEALEAEKRRQEEEKRKLEEEAKRKEEEARRQEEERIKAEEEARRQAEEAQRKEEEARQRAEEERIRAEEEAKKLEAAKKTNFFDSLVEDDEDFDLDLDEDDLIADATTDEIELEEESVGIVEETPVAVVEVPEPVVEMEVVDLVEETPVVEPVAVVEEPVAVVEEIVEKVEEVVVEETPVVEAPVEEFMEMAANMEPETVEEPVAEKESVEESVPQKETTISFLDRFLSEKENGVASEADKPSSVLDKIKESPSGGEPKRLIETINGNRKIKLDEIPIHKQYQYVQKVFDGNNVRFRIIVDKVNNAKNKDEVEEILGKFVFSNEALDKTDSVVTEFIQLLRNRF